MSTCAVSGAHIVRKRSTRRPILTTTCKTIPIIGQRNAIYARRVSKINKIWLPTFVVTMMFVNTSVTYVANGSGLKAI